MGTRKAKSYLTHEKSRMTWASNSSVTARNLNKEELGAVIFGCKFHTFAECVKNKIFGLPSGHYSYVKNIRPGLAIFLFNYSDRTLHGIYEASSAGQNNINSSAWGSSEGTDTTPYPAQVRVNVWKQCQSLTEKEFKPIIADNYYEERLFWFELDKEQAARLSALFLLLPWQRNPRSAVSQPRNASRPVLDKNAHSYSLVASMAASNKNVTRAPQKKWAELFNASPAASSHGDNHTHSEASPEVCDSFIRQSWDELADVDCDTGDLNEEKAEYEQDTRDLNEEVEYEQNMGELSEEVEYEQDPETDSALQDGEFESGVARQSAEAVLSGESESSHEQDFQPNLQFGSLAAKNSYDFEPALMKLLQDIEGIKMNQFEQTMKLNSLENELAGSKLEINQLKHQYKQLESTLSDRTELSGKDGCESSIFTSGESLFIIGGYNGTSWIQDLSSYSPSKDKVKLISSLTFERSYAALSCLDKELYIFGGIHEGAWYDTVESYNPLSNQWNKLPSLNQEKGSVAGASMHGRLYSIGGGNGVECFSEVEFFDIDVGKWILTRSMHEKRFGPAAVQFNDAIYVAGGYDGTSYLRSVERFDPRERSWTSLRSMASQRGGLSMVACKEKLYALGGYDGSKMISTVEVYDPRLNVWANAEPMSVCRGYFGSYVSHGKIHVIGGLSDKDGALDAVEVYEEGSGWRSSGTSAIGKRCFFSSCFWEN